jgi:hypothetical protein
MLITGSGPLNNLGSRNAVESTFELSTHAIVFGLVECMVQRPAQFAVSLMTVAVKASASQECVLPPGVGLAWCSPSCLASWRFGMEFYCRDLLYIELSTSINLNID